MEKLTEKRLAAGGVPEPEPEPEPRIDGRVEGKRVKGTIQWLWAHLLP